MICSHFLHTPLGKLKDRLSDIAGQKHIVCTKKNCKNFMKKTMQHGLLRKYKLIELSYLYKPLNKIKCRNIKIV